MNLALGEIKPAVIEPIKPKTTKPSKDELCECSNNNKDGKNEFKIDANEAEQFIEFENVLQNIIYVK